MNEIISEIRNMTTKQKIIVVAGILIFLISDISIIGKILIIIGIAAYFFMKRQLLVNNSYTLIVPIIQIIASFFLYEESSNALTSANKIDNLHNVSNYTPYLGDLGKGLDIANQLGALPEIERSESTFEYINAAGMANNVVSIGTILIIAFALTELYGVFRLGKLTKKQMLMFYGGASISFIVCSIYLGIYMEKFMVVLSSIFSDSNEYPFSFIFPIVTLILVGILYKIYSKALEKLYSCNI